LTDPALRIVALSVVCACLTLNLQKYSLLTLVSPLFGLTTNFLAESKSIHSDKMVELRSPWAIIWLLIQAVAAIEVDWSDPSVYFPTSATDRTNVCFFKQILSKVQRAQLHMG
jgi:hypothetical protein